MCDLNKSFKLCTCGSVVDLSKPFWELKHGARLVESFAMGIYLPDNPSKKKYEISDELNRIADIINEIENLFDFPYSPEVGDLLNIFDGKNIFRFSYSGHNWIPIPEGKLNRYRDDEIEYTKSDFGNISKLDNKDNRLFEFITQKVAKGENVVLIGNKELKWELPQGVYQLESLNDDPESIIPSICGKNRRMLSNNISLEDLELIDGIELHCQGGIIENGGIWIKKDSNILDESYQLISNAKCFVPILYEDDIYSNFEIIEHKWGNLSEDYLIFSKNENVKSVAINILNTLKQTVIIYLSS